jgi:hypothetical protein
MHWNFCSINRVLRVTPAMAAGVTDRIWDMNDVAVLIAAQEASATRGGAYMKRAE